MFGKGSHGHKSFSVGNRVSSATFVSIYVTEHSLIRISIRRVFKGTLRDLPFDNHAGTSSLKASKKTSMSAISS